MSERWGRRFSDAQDVQTLGRMMDEYIRFQQNPTMPTSNNNAGNNGGGSSGSSGGGGTGVTTIGMFAFQNVGQGIYGLFPQDAQTTDTIIAGRLIYVSRTGHITLADQSLDRPAHGVCVQGVNSTGWAKWCPLAMMPLTTTGTTSSNAELFLSTSGRNQDTAPTSGLVHYIGKRLYWDATFARFICLVSPVGTGVVI